MAGAAALSASARPATGLQRQRDSAAVVPAEQQLLNQYCVGCHNDRSRAGGLALDTLDAARAGDNAQAWESAVRRLRARAMPPAGSRRPDEHEYVQLISYLETQLDRQAASRPDPGRTDTLRRLTRTKYQNAIRDLFALDVDVAELLPKDDASFARQ
jgi:mono/diheme cytochrome c family protein